LIILIWSIANVFIPLEMALNRAWNIRESRSFWASQRLALAMVVVSGTLAFLFIAGAAATQGQLVSFIGGARPGLTQSVVSFIAVKIWMVPLTLVMFFTVFYIVPNTKITVKEVLPPAIFTGLLWEISNYLFMLFLPFLGLDDIYGGFVVTVSLMTWAYVSGIILVLGANLTARKVFPMPVDRVPGLGEDSPGLIMLSPWLRQKNLKTIDTASYDSAPPVQLDATVTGPDPD
jgi:YihY family inner membrane protein